MRLHGIISTTWIVVLGTSLSVGCAAPQEAKQEDDKQKHLEALRKYERTFNPADYDPEIPFEKKVEKEEPTPAVSLPTPATPSEEAERVAGFRVQVSFTENIDQANRIRDEVAPLFADQSVYVVYEAPYYKIRVGDFLNRLDANHTLRVLFENGHKDSWIVPDKVKKQP